MSKLVKIVLVIMLVAGIVSAYAAGDHDTKAEAVAMVKAVMTYIAVYGPDKAYAEIDKRDGMFTDHDLYVVVYDTGGKCLAHGSNPKLVGKDLMEVEDSDGNAYVKERITLAKTQSSFWQEYKIVNPITKKISLKETYCERSGETIVCAGVYKQ